MICLINKGQKILEALYLALISAKKQNPFFNPALASRAEKGNLAKDFRWFFGEIESKLKCF